MKFCIIILYLDSGNFQKSVQLSISVCILMQIRIEKNIMNFLVLFDYWQALEKAKYVSSECFLDRDYFSVSYLYSAFPQSHLQPCSKTDDSVLQIKHDILLDGLILLLVFKAILSYTSYNAILDFRFNFRCMSTAKKCICQWQYSHFKFSTEPTTSKYL